MKLGEALTVRARQAQKLHNLLGRIKANAISQEDAQPSEEPNALIDEYLAISGTHENLVALIQESNANTMVSFNGELLSLTALLQHREAMTRERNVLGIAAAAGSLSRDAFRFTHSELKYVSRVNVPELRIREDAMTEMIRKIDARIQSVNWDTEIEFNVE